MSTPSGVAGVGVGADCDNAVPSAVLLAVLLRNALRCRRRPEPGPPAGAGAAGRSRRPEPLLALLAGAGAYLRGEL